MTCSLLEIVQEFLTDDASHGLYTAFVREAKKRGFTLIARRILRNTLLGGRSLRDRLFLILEKTATALRLGVFTWPAVASTRSGMISDVLVAKAVLSSADNLLAKDNIFWPQVYSTTPGRPIRVGTLKWGGPDTLYNKEAKFGRRRKGRWVCGEW